MRFKCQIVETRGEDDTLEGIGVRWTEPHKFTECVLAMVGGLGFFVGLCGLGGGILAVGQQGAGEIILFGVAILVLASGVLWWAIVLPGRERELTFWRDGLMLTPLGLSTNFLWPGNRWLDHTGLRSIESEQLVFPKGDDKPTYTHGVRLFYASGDVNHIAKNLEPDDAHMLAVKLTQALKELRVSMATPLLVGRPQASGESAGRVID